MQENVVYLEKSLENLAQNNQLRNYLHYLDNVEQYPNIYSLKKKSYDNSQSALLESFTMSQFNFLYNKNKIKALKKSHPTAQIIYLSTSNNEKVINTAVKEVHPVNSWLTHSLRKERNVVSHSTHMKFFIYGLIVSLLLLAINFYIFYRK